MTAPVLRIPPMRSPYTAAQNRVLRAHLRALVASLGSQAAAAALVGVSGTTVGLFLSGRKDAGLPMGEGLARAMNKSVDELLATPAPKVRLGKQQSGPRARIVGRRVALKVYTDKPTLQAVKAAAEGAKVSPSEWGEQAVKEKLENEKPHGGAR